MDRLSNFSSTSSAHGFFILEWFFLVAFLVAFLAFVENVYDTKFTLILVYLVC